MIPTHPQAPSADATEGAPKSPNFHFLAVHHRHLVRYAVQAERYLFDDPSTALFKVRQFAELLAQQACAYVGVFTTSQDDFVKVLNLLRDRRVATTDVLDLFHGIRKAGNAAVHEGRGTQSDALHHLRMARQLAVWFHRSFGNDSSFKAGVFIPPPDPVQASAELHQELERLRTGMVEQQRQAEHAVQEAQHAKSSALQEAELRQQAEERARHAYSELTTALSLAEESEARIAQERALFEQQLASLQVAVAAQPADQVQAVVFKAQHAASLLDLDEAATRKIIDQQLRDAGWEADSEAVRFQKGVRPQKGKNLAIGEWPTASGPADYVLFVGLTPLATVEAKKAIKDVPGSIEQAKRYSRDYKAQSGEQTPGGPWGAYKIPFCLATNGRAFLRQIQIQNNNCRACPAYRRRNHLRRTR